MANWPVVADNTRFNIKNSAKGIMYESESNDNDEMRGWVWAKQLWNPDLDTKTLLKGFHFRLLQGVGPAPVGLRDDDVGLLEKWHKVPHKCGGAV